MTAAELFNEHGAIADFVETDAGDAGDAGDSRGDGEDREDGGDGGDGGDKRVDRESLEISELFASADLTEGLDIEERLALLSLASGPLRSAATAIAGRMIACRGWERLGYARIGDYARERLGQSGRTLTEWGRVERALRDRPRLDAALVSGLLPWSKVRLLARFEPGGRGRDEDRRAAGIEQRDRAANEAKAVHEESEQGDETLVGNAARDAAEAVWIAQAARMSVRTLERAVRVVDRGATEVSAALETDEEGISRSEREWVHVRGSARMAFAWNHACRMSSMVAGQRIAPGAALELVTAEVLSALPVPTESVDGADSSSSAGSADAVDAADTADAVESAEGLGEQRQCAGLLAGPLVAVPAVGASAAVESVGVGESVESDERDVTRPSEPGREARLCQIGSQIGGQIGGQIEGEDEGRVGGQDGGQVEDVGVPSPPALPAFVRSLVEGLEDADAFELDARLRRVVRLEQRLDSEIAPLLRRVVDDRRARRGLRGRSGNDLTLASYARDRLGMSPRKARALVRLEKLSDSCPELRSAFRAGDLSWVQAQILAPLLIRVAEGSSGADRSGVRTNEPRQADWRSKWIATAQQISVRRLEDSVRHALATGELAPESVTRVAAAVDVPATDQEASQQSEDPKRQTGARPTHTEMRVRVGIQAPRDVARLFHATLCAVRKLLEPQLGRMPDEGEAFEAMIEHALLTWEAEDPAVRRSRPNHRVFERDGWQCTVPGCSSRRNLQAHHIVFRSAGGGDGLENQTSLCAFHHHRGVHARYVRIRGRAPYGLRFELGVRPGQSPLVAYGSGERVMR